MGNQSCQEMGDDPTDFGFCRDCEGPQIYRDKADAHRLSTPTGHPSSTQGMLFFSNAHRDVSIPQNLPLRRLQKSQHSPCAIGADYNKYS
jgi:hypothetical protein